MFPNVKRFIVYSSFIISLSYYARCDWSILRAVSSTVRPAKFESLMQHFVANLSREETFDTYLKDLQTNREKTEARRRYAKH